jgi:hypothetical protein
VFVAANIDAVETAESIGIRRDRAASYMHDERGTRHLYRMMDRAISHCRMDASAFDLSAIADETEDDDDSI